MHNGKTTNIKALTCATVVIILGLFVTQALSQGSYGCLPCATIYPFSTTSNPSYPNEPVHPCWKIVTDHTNATLRTTPQCYACRGNMFNRTTGNNVTSANLYPEFFAPTCNADGTMCNLGSGSSTFLKYNMTSLGSCTPANTNGKNWVQPAIPGGYQQLRCTCSISGGVRQEDEDEYEEDERE